MMIFSGALLSNRDAFAAVRYTSYANRGTGYYYSQAGWWSVSSEVRSGKNGCGITAFATAASILYGKRITPRKVAEATYRRGYWNLRGNTPTNLVRKLASAAGLKSTTISKSWKSMLSALLKNRILVIRSHGTKPFTSGGHYVTVVGARSDGYFKIVDPGDKSYRPKWIYYSNFMKSMTSSTTIFALGR